jgi:putative ABC transport system substrate-binding protein
MRRRSIVIAAVATLLLAPEWTTAQQPKAKTPRVGILSPAEKTSTKIFDAFREGLRDLGYVDGQNIIIEYRLAAGDYSRLPTLAGELVRLPVDVIVVDGGPKVAQIAKDATSTIPIVGGLGADPVAAGLVRSFAHPGGNVTGFATLGIELSGKRLQLLKEAFPETLRVAVLRNSATANLSALHATEEAAHYLGVQLRRIDIDGPNKIATGFETALSGGAEALIVEADAMFWNERKQIVALATKYRVPAIYPEREYVDDGGLLAYGRNVLESWSRAVWYVDQILKGAKPGDLPIEQPTKFALVINLKTAKALGLTIPPSILARADEVIE